MLVMEKHFIYPILAFKAGPFCWDRRRPRLRRRLQTTMKFINQCYQFSAMFLQLHRAGGDVCAPKQEGSL